MLRALRQAGMAVLALGAGAVLAGCHDSLSTVVTSYGASGADLKFVREVVVQPSDLPGWSEHSADIVDLTLLSVGQSLASCVGVTLPPTAGRAVARSPEYVSPDGSQRVDAEATIYASAAQVATMMQILDLPSYGKCASKNYAQSANQYILGHGSSAFVDVNSITVQPALTGVSLSGAPLETVSVQVEGGGAAGPTLVEQAILPVGRAIVRVELADDSASAAAFPTATLVRLANVVASRLRTTTQ